MDLTLLTLNAPSRQFSGDVSSFLGIVRELSERFTFSETLECVL